MPLALVALASALDRSHVDVVIIDGRLEADPVRAVVDGSPGRAVCGCDGAHRRADSRRAGRVAGGEGGCAGVSRGVGRLASVAVCRRVPGRTRRSISSSPARARTRSASVIARLIDGERVRGQVVRGRLQDLNTFPAHDYSLIPVERYFALKARASNRLHLVAGLPFSLRVLRRPRGVRARLDRPRARAHRRRSRAPASAPSDATTSRSRTRPSSRMRRASTRSRNSSCAATCRSRGRRPCAPIRRAVSATICLPRRCDRACVA